MKKRQQEMASGSEVGIGCAEMLLGKRGSQNVTWLETGNQESIQFWSIFQLALGSAGGGLLFDFFFFFYN